MSGVTDPIADFLARVNNAIRSNKRRVEIPSSRTKKGIAQILKDSSFIMDFEEIEDDKQNVLRLFLKYKDGKPVIAGLKRVSSPGLRRYTKADDLPRVLNGYGVAVISTSKGVMTEKRARKERVGGEVLCYIW
ncbi:MAG: 30S ribosomal protein S8 [Ignavibacteriales bacterium]|nr:30S ribosomal protein S8 [Ignavibacteriales bacterium]